MCLLARENWEQAWGRESQCNSVGGRGDVRELGQLQFFDIEDAGDVALGDDVVEMEVQRGEVGGLGDALSEVDGYGGEACGGEVDFLVVRDLAE